MKILINEKLSEHRYMTPEGYLVCVDSVLARTGKQTYRRNEVFGDAEDDSEIEIDRPAEEVFSEATLASFENKPITVEHPDEDVNSENYKDYSVGFVRDIHKGRDNGQDVILGTLVIQDKKTIDEIKNGEHTDLSCGYDCDITEDEHPKQRNIRGNHVALCAQGRAGNARIVDTAINKEMEIQEMDDKVKDEFFSDATQIKNINKGYAILLRRVWDKRGEQAYAERWTDDIEEARRLKSTLERNDGFQFVIVQCHGTPKKVVDEEETVLEMAEKHEKTPDVEDATREYDIHWLDLAAKSKGWADYRHHDKIKADSLNEALKKLANTAGFGVGTANMLIISIHRDGASYQYTDKLSNLLKKDLKDEEVEDAPDFETQSGRKDIYTQVAMSALDIVPTRKWNKKGDKISIDNNRLVLMITSEGVIILQKGQKANSKLFTTSEELKKALINLKANDAVEDAEPEWEVHGVYRYKPDGVRTAQEPFTEYVNARNKDEAKRKVKQMLEKDGLFGIQFSDIIATGDSVNDALVAPDEKTLKEFERRLATYKFGIESKRNNHLSGVRYQVFVKGHGFNKNDLKFYAVQLNNISAWAERNGYPMTYNIGLSDDGMITAGIDIYGRSDK